MADLFVYHTLTLCSTEKVMIGDRAFRYKPIVTLKFKTIDELISRAWAYMDKMGDPFLWYYDLDMDAISLEDYVRVANLQADWLDQNPIEGMWIGRLYLNGSGYKTAREADDALFWSNFSDWYKEEYGVRPFGKIAREEAERMMSI